MSQLASVNLKREVTAQKHPSVLEEEELPGTATEKLEQLRTNNSAFHSHLHTNKYGERVK